MEIFQPTFIQFWNLTTKTGYKERLAKRWHYLPMIHRIHLFNKVLELKEKPQAEQYLNIGKK